MWISSLVQTNRDLRLSCAQLELRILRHTGAFRQLSQRLLKIQDEERRRLSRDLHDTAGQTLTALKLSICMLQRQLAGNKTACKELSAMAGLADEALREIRTTSYLLHPPLLDEAGFVSAAQWFVNSFSERSGISVRTDFAPEIHRLRHATEVVLFRVLQESLTNAYRHSGSSEVDVHFRLEGETVVLEVRDYGRGVLPESLTLEDSPPPIAGVGLVSMRERLLDVEGELQIEEASPGMRLKATVPYSEPALPEAPTSAQSNQFGEVPLELLQTSLPQRHSPSCG